MNSNKTKENKIFELKCIEVLLKGWLLHAHKGSDRHDRAARKYDTCHNLYGGLTFTPSTTVGTGAFFSLQKNANPYLTIIAGLVSVIAAILVALQTFLSFSSRADRHRATGVKYKEVIREIEQLLTQSENILNKPVEDFEGKDKWLSDLRIRLDTLEETAPVVPELIYERVEEFYNHNPIKFIGKSEELYQSIKHTKFNRSKE